MRDLVCTDSLLLLVNPALPLENLDDGLGSGVVDLVFDGSLW
jgi:hypothetical protein